MNERVMFFIDGENFVHRYQAMKQKGRQPLNGIVHEEDIFVWHPDVIKNEARDVVRATYYTSVVGDAKKIISISEQIKEIEYNYQSAPFGVGGGRYGGGIHHEQFRGHIFPCVFKKENKSARSRLVDISIVIDMLNYASPEKIDAVYLLSGDGDFIPLIKAVMRKGVRVYLMALSDGLNPELPLSVDEFECIDNRLFQG